MTGLAALLFVVAAAAFCLGLKLLARPTTARRGNAISAGGMLAAVVGALILAAVPARRPAGDAAAGTGGPDAAAVAAPEAEPDAEPAVPRLMPARPESPSAVETPPEPESPAAAEPPADRGRFPTLWLLAGLLVGTAAGVPAARLVKMTAMPEMVAVFNGFGGLSSLLVGWSAVQAGDVAGGVARGAVVLAVIVGGVTFTGSLIAFGKLSGRLRGAPVRIPGQLAATAAALVVAIALGLVWAAASPWLVWFVLVVAVAVLALGPLLVLPIGGADMPVVISLLNSYSGIAAAAAGFAIDQPLLIVTGTLVGASGLILTRIMCLAMNRSLAHVLFSGFGSGPTGDGQAAGDDPARQATVRTPADAFHALEAATSAVIVPGYGMAVAQAQHAVHELAKLMQANGTDVVFAIHPVAGRMPGHMSVLLAEADVPYEQLVEMDEVNARMDGIDVAIVIGANDTVNPAARDDPSSPLAGMPIVEVDRARSVFVLKRSLGSGYAGVDNPLFFAPNAAMILGDARKTVEALVAEFKDGG